LCWHRHDHAGDERSRALGRRHFRRKGDFLHEELRYPLGYAYEASKTRHYGPRKSITGRVRWRSKIDPLISVYAIGIGGAVVMLMRQCLAAIAGAWWGARFEARTHADRA
jgi:hypothetical protein